MSKLWNPHSIEQSIYLWFDGKDPNDNHAHGIPDNGVALVDWKSKGLLKKSFRQTTNAKRPTYSTSDSSLNFDGSDDLMTLTVDDFPSVFHVFIVARATNDGSGGNVLVFDSDTTGKDYKFIQQDGSENTKMEASFQFIQSGSSSEITVKSGTDAVEDTFNIFEFKSQLSKGTSATVSLNDGTEVTGSDAIDLQTAGTLKLMSAVDGTTCLAGKVSEILIFQDELTTLEQDAVQGYLEYKYDLNVLPSAHPFKNAPPLVGQVGDKFGGSHRISPREPIQVVKMYLDFCDNQFGVNVSPSTCTAAGEPCYNTKHTCHDLTNYRTTTNGKFEYAFTSEVGGNLSGISEYGHPALISVSNAPTEIQPTKGISVRSNVQIKIRDFYSTDRDIDPYVIASTSSIDGSTAIAGRSYNETDSPLPVEQGTYFQRFLSRNPHYINRPIEVYDGYIQNIDYDAPTRRDGIEKAVFIEEGRREYIIDSIDLNNDVCTIKCKDPLTLSDDLKAKVPTPTDFALSASLNADNTDDDNISIKKVSTNTTATAAELEAEFGTSGFIRINEEIMKYTRGSSDANMDLANANRGQWGTTKAEHDANDAVQRCIAFGDPPEVTSTPDEGSTINDVAFQILVTEAGVPAAAVNNAAGGIYSWADEKTTWLSALKIRTIISEPTAANKLINQLGQMVGVNFFYDDFAAQVNMRAETPELNIEKMVKVNDSHIIQDSFKLINAEKERISRVYYYYNLRDFTLDNDETKSFKNLYINIDADGEGVDEYGKQQNLTIFGWGIQDSSTATSVSQRILNRFKNTPKTCTFKVDASFDTISTGDHFFLTTQHITDIRGFPQELEMQCVSVKFDPKEQCYHIKAKQFRFAVISPGQIVDNSEVNNSFIDVTGGTGTENDRYSGKRATESYISSDTPRLNDVKGDATTANSTSRSFITARVLEGGSNWGTASIANSNLSKTLATEDSSGTAQISTLDLTLTSSGGAVTAATVNSNPATETHKGDAGHLGFLNGQVINVNHTTASSGIDCVLVLSCEAKMSNGSEPYVIV